MMMKGSSKLVMGATLIVVVSLAIVLALVLVLLAELYCSLLLRKRRLPTTNNNTTTAASTAPTSPQPSQDSSTTTLSSVYAQGVLLAPRSFLFPPPPPPSINKEEEKEENVHKQKQTHNPKSCDHHQVLEIQTQDPNHKTQNRFGFISGSASAPPSFITRASSPKPIQEIDELEVSNTSNVGGVEHFVYISNPIYDNEACREGGGAIGTATTTTSTPFETPESSPSHLEMGDDSSEEEEEEEEEPSSSSSSPLSMPMTPPLTPMKKLQPIDQCSSSVVSLNLRDVRSLGTSGSGSDTNNGLSSSSSGSPCTSPSW